MKNNKLNTRRIITGKAKAKKDFFPLECTDCNFRTNEPIKLGTHMKIHYTGNARKPRPCFYCGK